MSMSTSAANQVSGPATDEMAPSPRCAGRRAASRISHVGTPLVLALAAVGFLSGPSAEASVITVPNFSFEEDDVADSGSLNAAPSGWTRDRSGAGAYSAVWDPHDGVFAGTTGDNTQGVLPHGGQVLHLILLGDEEDENAFVSVISGEALAFAVVDMNYTLTVAAGDRLGDAAEPDEYEIAILLDDVVAASTILDGTTIANGGFQDMEVSYTTSAADAGKEIKIQLTHRDTDNVFSDFGVFDNVRFEAIPEPSTVGLMALGGALMLVRRRDN